MFTKNFLKSLDLTSSIFWYFAEGAFTFFVWTFSRVFKYICFWKGSVLGGFLTILDKHWVSSSNQKNVGISIGTKFLNIFLVTTKGKDIVNITA